MKFDGIISQKVPNFLMPLNEAQKHAIIRQASGLDTRARKIIGYYETQWFLRRHVPSVNEVATKMKLQETVVNYYLSTKKVQAALDKRGVPWKTHSQVDLTTEQVAAAITVMNFADTRSIAEKLDQLGVQPQQYYGWLSNPQFKNLVESLADQNLQNIRPTAIAEFTKLINDGDWKAIQYYLDSTGEFANTSTQTIEKILMLVIEVIQKHVRDPETIQLIARDLLQLNPSNSLELDSRQNVLTIGGRL